MSLERAAGAFLLIARTYEDPNSSPAAREATAVVFDSFHRYLGVAVSECLGYLLTRAWTLLVVTSGRFV
jgi:hypothetical protein